MQMAHRRPIAAGTHVAGATCHLGMRRECGSVTQSCAATCSVMSCAGGRGMSELPATIKHMVETCSLSVTDDRPTGSLADPGPAAGSSGGVEPNWPQDPDAPLVSLERLEERICELAGHLAAGTCRVLQLVAEFDAPRGRGGWGLPS